MSSGLSINYPSPDSSGSVITNETNSSIDPASSESLFNATAVPGSLPVFTPSFTGVGSSGTQERIAADDDVFKPPMDPNLMPRYLDIVNRPGPKSQKRRKLSELHNNTRSDQARRNSQPELVIDENDADQIYQRLIKASKKRKSSHRSSRSGSNSLNYSSSSSSRLQTLDSSEDRLIPSAPSVSQNSLTNLSPPSSQLTLQSPRVYQRPRRSPSSSLTSNEELLVTSTPPVPPPVVEPRELTPPVITTLQINDGNAHSNSGAPRRVQFNLNPAAGASSRDSREVNTKLTGG